VAVRTLISRQKADGSKNGSVKLRGRKNWNASHQDGIGEAHEFRPPIAGTGSLDSADIWLDRRHVTKEDN
jgi:hypothetical protein